MLVRLVGKVVLAMTGTPGLDRPVVAAWNRIVDVGVVVDDDVDVIRLGSSRRSRCRESRQERASRSERWELEGRLRKKRRTGGGVGRD
jgi:hypothetical protein